MKILIVICSLVSIALSKSVQQSQQVKAVSQEQKDWDDTWGPFIGSFLANILSEFGDKTFIIAAVMAMKYQCRISVFIGACGALIFMTCIGCIFGNYLPFLLSPKYTSIIAGVLLTVFGLKLLYDAYYDVSEDDDDDEKEIEKELDELDKQLIKGKQSHQSTQKEQKQDEDNKLIEDKIPLFSRQSWYIMTAAFSQVFFGEWGDKSQLTTVALAADNDAILVFLGSSIGQAFCTVFAVMGGKYLSKKVSERYLNFGGGILMLLFAVHAFFK